MHTRQTLTKAAISPPHPPPPAPHHLRFERKGFKLVGLKLYQTPKEVAEEHYKELASKPFYPKLVEYIVSGPVVAMVS
jgi:nucleoside diphosphate kinase